MADFPVVGYQDAQAGNFATVDPNEAARRAIDAQLALQQDPAASAAGGFRPITDPATDIGPQAVAAQGVAMDPNAAQPAAPAAPAAGVGYQPTTPDMGLMDEGGVFDLVRQSDAERVARENAARGGGVDPHLLYQAHVLQGNIAQKNREIGDIHKQSGEDQGTTHDAVAQQLATAAQNIDDLSAASDQAQQQQLDRQTKYQQTIEAQRKDALEASQKLDPTRLIGPAGSRIMFVISAALGALGQSFLGGRNNAVDIVNGMMDRDFEGQKSRLAGKKENLSLMQDQLAQLRQQGIDEAAARQLVKANMMESMATHVASLKEKGMSAESRAAGDILQKQFQMTADQFRLQGLQAAMRNRGGKVVQPKTASELFKEALALRQQLNTVRQGEQTIAKNASPQEDVAPADKQRQAKLAERVSGYQSAIKRLDELEGMMAGGQAPGDAMMFPNLAGKLGDEGQADKAVKMIRAIIADNARARGGPITQSDQEIEQAATNIIPSATNPMTWGTDSARQRLANVRALIQSNYEAALEGQPAEDVARVKSTTSQRPETAEERKKRLGGK